jgi:asparagine synthetase B (glutamine-hydrolysing)
MSAFGGILNLGNDPQPVSKELLGTLGNRLDAFGGDAASEIVVANLGMTYRAFHTTRESRVETQPLLTPEDHLLVWNGRLDNREELQRQLRHDLRNSAGTITDPEIVLAAYVKWGAACFVRLIGDFCLALWDEVKEFFISFATWSARALCTFMLIQITFIGPLTWRRWSRCLISGSRLTRNTLPVNSPAFPNPD